MYDSFIYILTLFFSDLYFNVILIETRLCNSLVAARVYTQVTKHDTNGLWDCRVEGVGNTLNYNTWHTRESLARTGVVLDTG